MSKKITVEVGQLGVIVKTEGEIRDLIEVLVILDAAMNGVRNEMLKHSKISPIVMPPGRS